MKIKAIITRVVLQRAVREREKEDGMKEFNGGREKLTHAELQSSSKTSDTRVSCATSSSGVA